MKQPNLGKKISELRTARGLTQEELVEKCNISVRTIQRIESGEVMPRTYTVKTIFAALDYDIEKISSLEEPVSARKIGLLQYAWIAGIVYLLLGILEVAAEVFRMSETETMLDNPYYIALKVVILLSFIIFKFGIFTIGTIYKQYLVRLVVIMLIAVTAASIAIDIASLYIPELENEWVTIGLAIFVGAVFLLYGVAILRLKDNLGNVATLAGALYIITGICFVVVLLVVFGIVFLFAAELLLIVAIYKVRQMLTDSNDNRNQLLGAI